MPTIASGLATVQLPPTANWMSFHSTPASASAESNGVDGHLHRGFALEPAERV